MDIKPIIDKLVLTEQDRKSVSIIFQRRVFKKVIDQVVQLKRDAISDFVKTQQELDNARFTKIGNEEIYEIFKGISSLFESENQEEEDFDPQDIINK